MAYSISIFDHGYHYPDITLDATKEATAEEVRLRVMKLYGPRPKNETAKYPEGAIELSKLTPVPVWAKELPGMISLPCFMNSHCAQLTYRSYCRCQTRVDRVLQGGEIPRRK